MVGLDLTKAQAVLAIVVSLLTIAGVIIAFVKSIRTWLLDRLKRVFAKGQLRFFIQQMPGRTPFWSPATINGKPGLQIAIRLEASNMTDSAFRIMSAQLAGRDAQSTVWAVQDMKSGFHAHNYPIPSRQIVELSANFLLTMPPPPSTADVLKERLVLTDHLGHRHKIRLNIRNVRSP